MLRVVSTSSSAGLGLFGILESGLTKLVAYTANERLLLPPGNVSEPMACFRALEEMSPRFGLLARMLGWSVPFWVVCAM